MNKLTRYSPDVRERAVRMVLEHQAGYGPQWTAVVLVASKLGCSAGNVAQLNTPGGARCGALAGGERRTRATHGAGTESRELRRANEFTQGGGFLPRRSSTAAARKGVFDRRAPGGVRGRAHLRRVADRPLDLLREQDARG